MYCPSCSYVFVTVALHPRRAIGFGSDRVGPVCPSAACARARAGGTDALATVHDDFRCVLIATAAEVKGMDAALLGRFEKQRVPVLDPPRLDGDHGALEFVRGTALLVPLLSPTLMKRKQTLISISSIFDSDHLSQSRRPNRGQYSSQHTNGARGRFLSLLSSLLPGGARLHLAGCQDLQQWVSELAARSVPEGLAPMAAAGSSLAQDHLWAFNSPNLLPSLVRHLRSTDPTLPRGPTMSGSTEGIGPPLLFWGQFSVLWTSGPPDIRVGMALHILLTVPPPWLASRHRSAMAPPSASPAGCGPLAPSGPGARTRGR